MFLHDQTSPPSTAKPEGTSLVLPWGGGLRTWRMGMSWDSSILVPNQDCRKSLSIHQPERVSKL